MSDQTVQDPFAQPVQDAPASQPTSQDLFADQLKAITNEEGNVKYDSVPKALEGLKNAQEYIPQLKQELATRDQRLAELEAELAKRQSVEDVVARLQPTQAQPEPAAPTMPQEGLNEEAVAKLFENFLSQKEQKTAMESNRQKVNSTLSGMYGEKAGEVIATKASQLGLSTTELGDLANTKPDLVLALFNTASKSGVNTTSTSYNIPPTHVKQEPLARPTKSLLSGATSREQADFMRQIQAEVYAKYGVTE